MPEGELLQNLILSSGPCPICVDAAGQDPMTFEAWANSEWGLPGSDARYCKDACHCLLMPVGMLDEFPELSKQAKLRGEEGTEIESVVDIGPSEQGLKEVMEEWNAMGMRLPPEIYKMDLMKVEAYLRGRIRKLGRSL